MNENYSLSTFATAALPALRAARTFVQAGVSRVIADNIICDPETGIYDRDTLDELAVSDVAAQEALVDQLTKAILEMGPGATDLISADDRQLSNIQVHQQAVRENGLFSENPNEYGVTVTADVTAPRPEDAPRAFVAALGIGNTDGLTFHVEQLRTGKKFEFDEV